MESNDELSSYIKQYISQLSPMELKAMEIAKNHLESSFCLEKSTGFVHWLKKENEK